MAFDGTLNFDTKIDSSGFQSGINKISGIAKTGLAATTAALGVVGTAIGAIGTFSVKAGSDFEASMSNVAAIAGLTSKEAGSDYDILVQKAKEVASQSKFTAAETADALSFMAMAGWQTEDMAAALSSVVNLAAASGQDLASTSDILTDAITALGHTASDSTGIIDEFGNEVSYATHFADILAAASSNSNTNVGLMGETFKYAATMAGSLGYSAEDLALAIGLMANSGIKGSMAGTSLNTMMTRLSTNSNGARDAIEALGVSFYDQNGQAKDLSTVLEGLREATKNMTDEEKANFANKVAGMEAQKGLLAILNASTDDYDKLKEAIYGSDGAAQQMADTMNDNLQGQLTMLKSQLDILGVSIYESLQVPLKDAVGVLQEFAEVLQNAYDEGGMDALIDKSGEVLAGIVTKMAEAAPQVVEVALSVATSFINSLLDNKDAVASAGAELVTTLATGIISFSGDLWSCAVELFAALLQGIAENMPQIVTSAQDTITQFGTALAENAPSIASSAVQIISALASGFVDVLPQLADIGRQIIEGLIQGISEESPELGAFFSGIFEGIQEVAGPAIDALKSVFESVSSALSSIDPETAKQIGEAIVKIATAILLFNGAKSVVSTIIGIGQAFLGFKGNIVQVFADVQGVIPGLLAKFTSIGSSLSGLASSAMAGISAFGSTVLTGFGAVVSAIGVGPLIAIAAAIAAIIAVICNWDAVSAFFTETVPAWWTGTAWPAITGLFESVATWFSELPGKIVEFLSGVLTSLGEWVASIIEWAMTNVPLIVEAIATFFSQLPGRIWSFLVQVWTGLVSWGSNMLSNAISIATSVITAICNFFAQLPGNIANLLTQAFARLVAWGAQMISSARSAASNVISAIVSFFSQLPGRLASLLSSALSRVVSWGSQLVSAGRSAASQLCNAVISGVSSLPGRMAAIGSNIVSGIISGISGAAGALYSTLSNLASSALSAAKSALGINSPSKVFRDKVGLSIPEGITVGIKRGMPELLSETKAEIDKYVAEMSDAVNKETMRIRTDSGTLESFKARQAYETAFGSHDTAVNISGEIHTHVELDGEEVGNSTTPIVDRNLARIDQHKKRGG